MLSGQFDLANANETVAIANNTDVARFTDTNLADTASSFTATIDWGDGTTTTGTVVGSNGSFTVEGGHTYTDENQFPALVTVTRTADNSQLLLAGTVAVADKDAFNNLNGTTITYTPNQPLTNVTVATFTDPNTANVASDFSVSIDWGDGTTTAGTVQGSAGSFSIVGSHTYTAAGEFAVSVAMADDAPDAASGFVTGKAVSGFGGAVTFTSATEGTANNGVTVATFADTSGSHVATDYTANIDWGDGTTTPGTISGSGQSFTVIGSHTYADEEDNEVDGTSPLMKVSITRAADSHTIAPSGTVLVSDATPIMTSKTIGASPNQALTNVTVATFTDPNQGDIAGDFTATINWGDGSDLDTVTASVSGSNGSFTVTGSHTYTSNGQNNVTVSILEDIPNPAQTGVAASKAIIGLAPGQFSLSSATEGVLLSGQAVATFNDGNTSDTAAAFNAAIDWGDGTTTPGTIAGASGSFTVTGTHSYADEGDEPVAVTVTRTADLETATISGTTTVIESDTLSLTANNISGNPGQPFTNVQVASFTTTYLGNVAADFTASIDWGDGTTTAGTVAGGSGSFSVTGSHTYTAGGNDTLKVTVADDAPGTATKTGTSTATINFAGQMVLNSATEATALPNSTPVATFSDSNGGDTAASFTATINWGDGVTSAGTVSGGAGTFTVSGGHTYADEGNDQARVTLTRTSDSATSTASGGVAVAENDVLSVQATSFSAKSHQAFNGTVATFTDSNSANVAGDFTASIDWGDGATTAGTVSGSNGAFTVSGSHTYAAAGQDTVKVTVADDAPGTANGNAQTTVTVGAGSIAKNDFNADSKSDLLLQNAPFAGTPDVKIELLNGTSVASSTTISTPSAWTVKATADFNHDNFADIILQNSDGLPEIWLMNGTSVTSTVTLPNPGPTWHIIATGDFNADGNPDILLQNNDGLPAIWEMNGTSIVSMATLSDPGPTWRAIGTGDFNGDGKSDILWQNVDGLPGIWLMNGTSPTVITALSDPGPTWHAIGTGDFNGDGKADILWQNNDGLPGIWLMNGVSIASHFALPNPGSTWHLQDDGPISPDQMASGSQQPALHLSSPDTASAVPMLSSPDTANAVVELRAGGGVNNAGAGNSAALGSLPTAGAGFGDPSWMRQILSGSG